MRSFGTIRKYDTRFVPEYSSFHGTRNPPGEGSEHRSSQASRLCTQQAGVANLKVAGHQRLLANALERLLGKGRPQIIQVAKETLEGNLRGVLSQLPPEEVNQDKLRFAEKLLEEAEHGLSRLGLVLDVLKIQNVADEVGYLDSLGRKQTASLDRSARVAEAELKVQKARLEQVRLKLEADVVAPARADMEKRQAEARGRAARIVEDGRATAAVLTQMIQAWKAAGPNARDIFLTQKLQTVMSSLVETIREVKVDRVAYLPASAKVAQGVQLVEQVKAAFGVDLAKVVERLGAPGETLASAKLMAGETLGAASQTAPAKPKA